MIIWVVMLEKQKDNASKVNPKFHQPRQGTNYIVSLQQKYKQKTHCVMYEKTGVAFNSHIQLLI